MKHILVYLLVFLFIISATTALVPKGSSTTKVCPTCFWHITGNESMKDIFSTTQTYTAWYPRFRNELQPGIIVAYKIPYEWWKKHPEAPRRFIHRIIRYDKNTQCYTLRGDSNQQNDPWCVTWKDITYVLEAQP